MTTAPPAEAELGHPPPPARSPSSIGTLLAWALLAGWLVVAAGVVLAGEREATVGDLRDAIASGDVDEVGAAGALGRGQHGSAQVELHWTEHGIRYVTEVRQVRPPRGDTWLGGDVTGNLRGDLAEALSRDGRHVLVVPTDPTAGGMTEEVLGWRVGDRWALAVSALFVLTVLRLVAGPEPWRATRWAWFWLLLTVPPVFGAAYLLLGGPTGLARPAAPGRRLTGGWAFVLSLVVGCLPRL